MKKYNKISFKLEFSIENSLPRMSDPHDVEYVCEELDGKIHECLDGLEYNLITDYSLAFDDRIFSSFIEITENEFDISRILQEFESTNYFNELKILEKNKWSGEYELIYIGIDLIKREMKNKINN